MLLLSCSFGRPDYKDDEAPMSSSDGIEKLGVTFKWKAVDVCKNFYAKAAPNTSVALENEEEFRSVLYNMLKREVHE